MIMAAALVIIAPIYIEIIQIPIFGKTDELRYSQRMKYNTEMSTNYNYT